MIELWIPITIGAAFLQNLRSALQKHLKTNLSTSGATYVRFFYAWPFAVLYVFGLNRAAGMPLPDINGTFLAYCLAGSATQIASTALLVWLFSFRNFAVGTTYSKTEIVQVALLGYLFLGDVPGTWATVAICISVVGVMALSAAQTKVSFANLFSSLTEKATLIGLASGATLGASVVFFRGAALALDYEGSKFMAAAFALMVALLVQTVAMGAWLLWRDRATFRAVIRHWPWALAVGVSGVMGSIAWFTAFTLENASYVRALGQIELVFTFAASIFFFKERTSAGELVGIALIVAGILLLILTT